MVEFRSQSEITDPYLQILSEQEVSQFEIPMNDHLVLKILDGKGNLLQIIPDFDLTYSFSSLYQLIHSLVSAQLQDYVDVYRILEVFLVFHHELRFHRFMDLYLSCELYFNFGTFSFAFDRVRVAFSMILAAYFFPVAV